MSAPQKSIVLDKVNFILGFSGISLIILGSTITNDRYDTVLSGFTGADHVVAHQNNMGTDCSLAFPFGELSPKAGQTSPASDFELGFGVTIKRAGTTSSAATGTGLNFYKWFGFFVFAIGWALVSVAAATYYQPKSSGTGREITWNPKAGPIILTMSATTAIATSASWYHLSTYKNNDMLSTVGITGVTVASWIGFAFAIAYKKGYFDMDRFILAGLGVVAILSSMAILSSNRRFKLTGQSLNQNTCPNVYNIGLPLFVLGWMLLVVAFTME